MIKKTITKGIMGISLLCATFGANAQNDNPYGLTENIQDGNILHVFNWTAAQAMEEMENIAKAGFTAIQISPIQARTNTGVVWADVYRPYDFAFRGNGMVSNEQRLQSLIETAHQYGVKVIVDVVCNHVDQSSHDKWWNSNGRIRSTTAGVNYNTRAGITQFRLSNLPDVNSEDPEVQERAKDFVQALKDWGVDGIRWDAAKHIGLPSEKCDFWTAVMSVDGLYHYGEVLGGPGGPSNAQNDLMKEYAGFMSMTDDTYSRSVLSSLRVGNAPASAGNWTNKGIPASKLLYWGESHDTYSNVNGETKNVAQEVIDRAWAIGACRNGATSLYFSRPSAKEYGDIKVGVKGSLHFMDPEIAEVNHFKNAMVGKADSYTTGSGVACITRENGGAVIVVAKGGSQAVSVPNGGGYCPAGEYVDRVSGNTFTVTSETITGTTGASGIAVIYNDDPAGIDGVEIEGITGVPEYYTLQGVRVSHPTASGFYIVRQGSLTTKVYIR